MLREDSLVNKDLAKLEQSRLSVRVCELTMTRRKCVNNVFLACVVDLFMYVLWKFYSAKTAMKASASPHYLFCL